MIRQCSVLVPEAKVSRGGVEAADSLGTVTLPNDVGERAKEFFAVITNHLRNSIKNTQQMKRKK